MKKNVTVQYENTTMQYTEILSGCKNGKMNSFDTYCPQHGACAFVRTASTSTILSGFKLT